MKNTLISLLIFLFLFSILGFFLAIRPFRIISSNTPETYGISYEKITFQTKDKLTLHGWFIPNKNPHAKTIILMHGYPADKGNILPATLFLHKSYNLLYFDFRYLGESDGHYSTLGKNEVVDLFAAIHYLHTRHIDEVGVWGFSMGGAVGLLTAPLVPEIKAMVIESGYARLDWMAYQYYRIPLFKYLLGELTRLWAWLFFGFDIKNVCPACSAEKISIPVLLIYSTKDQVVDYDNLLLIKKALKNNPNVEIVITDKQHGEHIKSYSSIVEKFFNNGF